MITVSNTRVLNKSCLWLSYGRNEMKLRSNQVSSWDSSFVFHLCQTIYFPQVTFITKLKAKLTIKKRYLSSSTEFLEYSLKHAKEIFLRESDTGPNEKQEILKNMQGINQRLHPKDCWFFCPLVQLLLSVCFVWFLWNNKK